MHILMCDFKWSGAWSTGTVGCLISSERHQYLDGWPPWIPSAWFHFHFCQTWYSGLLRTVLTSVGTTRKTVIRLGWSRIGLAVLILHAAGAGLIGRPAVISGRYDKCHSLQPQYHYAHFPPLQHAHIHAKTTMRNGSWGIIMGFEALYTGRGRRNSVWSGKEAHWSLRGWIVKSAEHCGADSKPLDRYMCEYCIYSSIRYDFQ